MRPLEVGWVDGVRDWLVVIAGAELSADEFQGVFGERQGVLPVFG